MDSISTYVEFVWFGFGLGFVMIRLVYIAESKSWSELRYWSQSWSESVALTECWGRVWAPVESMSWAGSWLGSWLGSFLR